jgi:hypothetical protein
MSKTENAPDLSGFVNASGKRLAYDPKNQAFKAAPRVAREQRASYHNGFSVVGYPPGAIDRAKADADKKCADWGALSDQEKAERIANGSRKPVAFDRAAWLANNRPKRVRNRPFEIPAAADECAALATRAGWDEVRVEAQAKGTEQPMAFA